MLARLRVDEKDLRVIKNLYNQQKASVGVEDELTETVDIERVVQEGCVLSPDLIILHGEIIMREIGGIEAFSIGGRNVNNIRYADDTVLLADSVEKLQALFDVGNRASKEKGLKIKREKTECLMVSRRSETPVCSKQIETELVSKLEHFQ